MKIKSFAMLAVSGLIAASVAYVAPAMADDMSATNPSAQQQSAAQPAAPSDSNNSSQNQNASGQANSSDSANSGTMSSDEGGSPDTATGDDDY